MLMKIVPSEVRS